MKRLLVTLHAVVVVLCLAVGSAARAEEYQEAPPGISEPSDAYLFTPDELDDLLAPIALYPDPLLAQILPASTFVDQIDEAARYVRLYGNDGGIDSQPWDVSVRAVAHYPEVLFMMDMKYDWTVSLGQAFVNQQDDVMDAIQRLRADAEAMGNLESSPQQQVLDEDGVISIVPAEPEVIYVPQYDPLAVYEEEAGSSYVFVTFGAGFRIGAWLNRDCDWQRHRVYYHGWRGSGWIGRARPYIPVRNNVYINRRYSTIDINRRVERYDTTGYRATIRRDVRVRGAVPGRPVPPGREIRPSNRGGAQGTPPRQFTTAPAPVPAPAAVSPGPATRTPSVAPAVRPPARTIRQGQPENNRDIYRGRQPQGAQPAPTSGYGGYGSGRDAATYRERGRASRENVREFKPKPPSMPSEPSRGAASPGVRQSTPSQTPAPAVRQAPQPRSQPEKDSRDERDRRGR